MRKETQKFWAKKQTCPQKALLVFSSSHNLFIAILRRRIEPIDLLRLFFSLTQNFWVPLSFFLRIFCSTFLRFLFGFGSEPVIYAGNTEKCARIWWNKLRSYFCFHTFGSSKSYVQRKMFGFLFIFSRIKLCLTVCLPRATDLVLRICNFQWIKRVCSFLSRLPSDIALAKRKEMRDEHSMHSKQHTGERKCDF